MIMMIMIEIEDHDHDAREMMMIQIIIDQRLKCSLGYLSHVLHPPQSNTRPFTHDDYSDCDVDDESDDGGGPGKSDPNRCTKSHT